MVTPAAPAVERRPDRADEQRQDHVPDRCGRGRTQIVYKTFSTDPVHSYDDPNPGIYLVGFEATVPADKWATFTTTPHPKLIPAAEKPFSPSGPGRRRRLSAPWCPESAENAARLSVRPPQKRRFRNIVNEKNINLYKDILLTHP